MATVVPTTIHTAHGYSLYSDSGKPRVRREWMQRVNGIPTKHHTEFDLVRDHFGSGAKAQDAWDQLSRAWDEWRTWIEANTR